MRERALEEISSSYPLKRWYSVKMTSKEYFILGNIFFSCELMFEALDLYSRTICLFMRHRRSIDIKQGKKPPSPKLGKVNIAMITVLG